MKRVKGKQELTPIERRRHLWADFLRMLFLLASFPLRWLLFTWPLSGGVILTSLSHGRGEAALIGFFTFLVARKVLCDPATEWLDRKLAPVNDWLDSIDPAVYEA